MRLTLRYWATMLWPLLLGGIPSIQTRRLVPEKQLAIADRHRKQMLDDDPDYDWRLESVSLLPLDAKNDKWCWSIYFAAFPKVWPGPNDHDPFLEVFVLMNGDVVPSERRTLSKHIPQKSLDSRRKPIEDMP